MFTDVVILCHLSVTEMIVMIPIVRFLTTIYNMVNILVKKSNLKYAEFFFDNVTALSINDDFDPYSDECSKLITSLKEKYDILAAGVFKHGRKHDDRHYTQFPFYEQIYYDMGIPLQIREVYGTSGLLRGYYDKMIDQMSTRLPSEETVLGEEKQFVAVYGNVEVNTNHDLKVFRFKPEDFLESLHILRKAKIIYTEDNELFHFLPFINFCAEEIIVKKSNVDYNFEEWFKCGKMYWSLSETGVGFKCPSIPRKVTEYKRRTQNIVSLGHNCTVAEVSREKGKRRVALPFDWLATSLSFIIEQLSTDFKQFPFSTNDYYLKKADDNHLYLTNKEKSVVSLHDIECKDEVSLPTQLETLQRKYLRRIARFNSLFPGRVTFVRISLEDDFHDIVERDTEKKIVELCHLLTKKYPTSEMLFYWLTRSVDLNSESRIGNVSLIKASVSRVTPYEIYKSIVEGIETLDG